LTACDGQASPSCIISAFTVPIEVAFDEALEHGEHTRVETIMIGFTRSAKFCRLESGARESSVRGSVESGNEWCAPALELIELRLGPGPAMGPALRAAAAQAPPLLEKTRLESGERAEAVATVCVRYCNPDDREFWGTESSKLLAEYCRY
jgi:hypothetical protein